TSRAPSRNLATSGVRNGSPGTRTKFPTSPGPRPMWYFFASLSAIGRILARLCDSVSVHPRDYVRRLTDFAFDDAPRVAHTTRDPFDQVLRPRVHDDQGIALADAGADGRFD